MKFEWKNQEKNLYLPKKKPELVIVPKQKFFMISGKGNPNSEEFSEKIFELFQRLSTTKYSGTGVGLAICKKIIQNHHGIIRASGHPSEGAKFEIFLPV